MTNFLTRSLRGKLAISFILVALIPLAVSGYISFLSAKGALEEAAFAKLRLMWDAKERELVSWFDGVADDLTFMAQGLRVRVGLEALTVPPEDAERVKNDIQALSATLESYLALKTSEEGFEDLLLLDGKTGKVLYAQKKLSDAGGDVMAGALKDTGLAKVWELVVKHQKPAISDFGIYPPTGAPAAFVGAPVLSSQTRQFLGVLAARVNINRINQIMTWGEGSGKTAEVYVVGKDLLMRCQSHFEKDPTLLKKKVETEPVTQAFEGKQGSFVAKAYRVEATYAYSGLVGLNKQKQFMADFDWAMVNEEDRAEALRPMAAQSYRLIAFALVASALVILVALLLARGIAGPIIAISDVASQVSQGNLSIQVPQFKRGDEVGALGEAVRVMVASVRNSAMSLQEGIQILSSAAAEISATVAQVATSTTQTSSAVTETTTTVEEVKQAAKLASERAKTVSQSAQQAFQISEAGRKATDDTVHRINLIKEQMESIGETVVRLSEHSQAIEEIIATVQDLADQSNLLAVNASIEAARAGEQGRGFAVVAHEIKALADQSKQATQQVRSILDDTRKWVSAVVMATEQGGRAVRAGVEQSTAAGEAIQKLSASVGTSSHAASVIDTTLEQQFVGIDQVANAMASIEHAMKQTVGATAQLDDAARRLALLGEQLKELMERWKV